MEGTKVITIIGAIASAVVGVVSVIIGLNNNNTQQPIPVQQPRVVYTTPVYQQPIYQQPVQPVCVSTGTGYTNQYQQPAYQQPAYQQPAYQQPAYQQPAYQQPVCVSTGTGYTNQYQQPQTTVYTDTDYTNQYQQPAYQQPAYQPQQPQVVYDGISDPNYGVGEGIFGCSAIPAYCNYQTNPTVSIPSYQPPPPVQSPPVQQPTQPVSDNYYGNARPSSPQQPLTLSESRESILSEDYAPGMYERFKTLFESVQNDLPLIKEMEEKQKIREGNYRDTVYSTEGWGK